MMILSGCKYFNSDIIGFNMVVNIYECFYYSFGGPTGYRADFIIIFLGLSTRAGEFRFVILLVPRLN